MTFSGYKKYRQMIKRLIRVMASVVVLIGGEILYNYPFAIMNHFLYNSRIETNFSSLLLSSIHMIFEA